MKRLLVFLTCALLAAAATSCAEPARRPDKPATPTGVGTDAPTKPRPAWTEGEFPEGRAFWGTGEARVTGTEDEAKAAATKKATANLDAETALMITALQYDHEEQVAEIITRYPAEEFNGHIAGAFETSHGKIVVVDTYVDKSKSPHRVHVLVTLTLDDLFAAIYAREGLPDEQKKRIMDYEDVFRDGVMTKLSR